MKDIVSMIILLNAVCADTGNLTVQYAHIYESVILLCQQTKSAKGLQWLRNNTILTDGQQINNMSPWHSNYAIENKTYDDQYNLQIANVSADDFGDYLCVMQSNEGVSKLRIRLKNKGGRVSVRTFPHRLHRGNRRARRVVK